MRYAIAAKFVPDHDGHDERWCSYCEAFEDGYEVAEARADVDGLVARLREAEEALDRIASGHPLDDGTELREWVEWAQTDADAALDWNRRKAEAPE